MEYHLTKEESMMALESNKPGFQSHPHLRPAWGLREVNPP